MARKIIHINDPPEIPKRAKPKPKKVKKIPVKYEYDTGEFYESK